MLKNKVNSKLGAMAVALFALLFLGAGCEKQKQQDGAPGETPAGKPAAEEAFEPLKLAYELKNFGPTGPGGKSNMTIWLEDKRRCAGREVYVGVMKMSGGGQNSSPAWSKITVYADNGETAVSRFENEDKLAFDDIQPEYNQLDVALTMNSIFAYAGKNFNSPDVWMSTAPIILKNVDSGMSMTDYSVIRQEEQATGVLPCQKFKTVAKGTNTEGTFNSCVAREVNKIKLPFVVSFAFGDPGQGGPSWQLKNYSKEKSGVAFTPQCMEPVKCSYVKEPVQAERSACASKGGQIEQQRTEKGCVTGYKCFTQEEIVNEGIARMQRPGCPINQDVKNKLLGCRKNNQPNFDVTKYDEGGCALSVSCRQ